MSTENQQMKTIILGGFLGSGKTTTLMQLARYLVDSSVSDHEYKVVILENEVGEVGIDDAYLRSGGFSVDNLFSGCACCTVAGELLSAAVRIQHEMNPEWLIVETTGVAYPRSMQENMKTANIDTRIVILADAQRWERLFIPMQGLLRGQIEGSDAVLVNKIDLVGAETIERVKSDIAEFEPNTQVFCISALSPIDDDVWKSAAGK